MDVEKARPAVPALMELYQDTKRPEHLEALARYKDERSKQLFIEALEYSDDDFDRATIAAGVLGEMKSPDAVDPLIKAAEKQLPIKSRANNVRIAAIRALVKIGDKRAVPTLMKILTTSADDQDFLLNQKSALALAEFRDPQSIPALLQGLFMTGRGAGIFQECRLALVRIGPPAVDPLIQLLQEKNPDIQEMAKKLKFEEPPPVGTPGVVPHKAAILLGDLRAKKAVPALTARLHMKARGDEQRSALIALGYIADAPAVDAILAFLRDPKADPAARASAADALYLSGDRRAVPTLFEIAKSGYVVTGGQKASDLRASAAIALSRIAGKESFDAFKALADKETEAQGVFGMALDRMLVANECDRDIAVLRQEAARPVVDARGEGGVRDRLLGQRQGRVAAAAGGDEADRGDERGALPGAPGDPVLAVAPRHQGLRGVHRQAGEADRARREGGAHPRRARPAGRDARDDGDHPEPRHQGHHGAEHARPRRRGGEPMPTGKGKKAAKVAKAGKHGRKHH